MNEVSKPVAEAPPIVIIRSERMIKVTHIGIFFAWRLKAAYMIVIVTGACKLKLPVVIYIQIFTGLALPSSRVVRLGQPIKHAISVKYTKSPRTTLV